MQKIIGAALLVLVTAVPAFGQGISPIIQQLRADKRGRASGEFQILNNSMVPIASVLEVKAFFVKPDGQVSLGPLDANTHVRLSQTSAKVPPMSAYHVSFDVDCVAPCAFQLIAFANDARRPSDGVSVRTGVGSAIYVWREQIQKGEVNVSWLDAHTLLVENTSVYGFDRPDVDATVSGKTAPVPSFPLFPGTRRYLHFDTAPSKVVLQFAKFKLETEPKP